MFAPASNAMQRWVVRAGHRINRCAVRQRHTNHRRATVQRYDLQSRTALFIHLINVKVRSRRSRCRRSAPSALFMHTRRLKVACTVSVRPLARQNAGIMKHTHACM